MQNNIRNTNLRFNLDKEQQRRAWEYLQTMDRQFKSTGRIILKSDLKQENGKNSGNALVFDRYYRTRLLKQEGRKNFL